MTTRQRLSRCRGWIRQHRHGMRPGDWLVLGLAVTTCILMTPQLWQGGSAERAVIKRDGLVVAEFALNTPRHVEVMGAIGRTVIEIQPGKARVLEDPGPRQYCVQQGWLTRVNAIAICAPNHVSLALTGRQAAYDSLAY